MIHNDLVIRLSYRAYVEPEPEIPDLHLMQSLRQWLLQGASRCVGLCFPLPPQVPRSERRKEEAVAQEVHRLREADKDREIEQLKMRLADFESAATELLT
ncbi:unnamed protein product [Symbiodinium natans]|uniref:Uncharacterized protein n=1 Tax=Symbiodinium natans TaxID=878477 RepID=A0A812V4H8_9DINO|nr:unnamed protein product [Symbiodinium natans]